MFINPFGLKNTWKLSVLSFYLCLTWFLSFSVPSLNAPKQLMVTHFLRYIEKFVSFLMETRLWRQDLNTHCDNQEYKIGWHMTCWVTLHCVKKNCRMTLNEHVGCICHTAFKLNFQIYLMATQQPGFGFALPWLLSLYLFTQNRHLSLTLPKCLKILTTVWLPGVETIDKNNNRWNVLTVNSWETHLI